MFPNSRYRKRCGECSRRRISLSRSLSWKLAAASKAHVRQVLVPDEFDPTEADWQTPFLMQMSRVDSVQQAYQTPTGSLLNKLWGVKSSTASPGVEEKRVQKEPTSPPHSDRALSHAESGIRLVLCDGHPPHVIFNDSISSLIFNLLKSLARLFGVNSNSVPLKSLSE